MDGLIKKYNKIKETRKERNNSKFDNKNKFLLSYNSELYSYFFIIIFFMILMDNKVFSYSEITIKVKGTGEQTIISASKQYCTNDGRCNVFDYIPDEIYVNNELQSYRGFKVYGLKENITTIKLVFYGNVTNCISLFNELDNIIEADLSKFDASSVTNMYRMFCSCHYLTSINLSNFNTSKCVNMRSMFSECYRMTSLDLKSFDTSHVTEMSYMFHNTQFTKLDFYNFNFSSLQNYKNIFQYSNENLTYCLDNEKIEAELKESVFSTLSKPSDCSFTCNVDSNIKIITEKNVCIESCNNELNYKFEYNNICYKNCPNNTFLSPYDNNLCLDELICINYYNYEHKGCINTVPDGFYLNDSIARTIDKCDIKCNRCCLESIKNDSCITCNIENNYYHIFNDSGNINSFVKCFNEIPEGYFLDNSNKVYKKCYKRCKKCKDLGDDNNNKCLECLPGFILNKTNCNEYIENFDVYLETTSITEIPTQYTDYLETSTITEKPTQNADYLETSTITEKPTQNADYMETSTITEKPTQNTDYMETSTITEKPTQNTDYLETSSITETHTQKNSYLETSSITEKPTQNEKCPSEYKYLIIEKNECVKKCSEDNEYKYEYNNKCYKECPEKTYISPKNGFLCDKTCPDDSPYENTNTNECIKECSPIEFLNSDCKVSSNDMNIKDDIISKIKEDLTKGNLDEILENLLDGDKEDLIVKDSDITYQITTTDNQNLKDYEDISVIYIGECEERLRKANNISENDPIIILKFDINKEGLSIPIVQYEAYDSKTKKQLDLSVCNDTKINIVLPVSINESEIYKYNSSNEYYNDICYTYTTENGTDIILSDRKSEYNDNNLSLCEVDCELIGYDSEKKKVNCECNVKEGSEKLSEILDKKNLLNNFIDLSYSTNIKIIKCYKVVFTKDGLIKNSGSYIILTIILITIVCLIMLLFRDFKILLDIISKIKNSLTSQNSKNALLNKNNIDVFIRKNAPNKKSKKNKPRRHIIYNIQPLFDFKNINIVNKKGKKKKKKKKRYKRHKSSADLFQKSNDKLDPVNILITGKKDENRCEKEKKRAKKNTKRKEYLIKTYNDYELNTLSYEDAIKYDKRTFLVYYISLLQRKISIIFAFYTKNDYNLRSIKISLFFFNFALTYTVNALFFNDETMHKIYVDNGKFNFLYQLPQILYSTIITVGINTIIRTLSLSEKNIIMIKKENKYINQIITKVIKCIKIKFSLLFTFTFILLFLFWYYTSCFCAIYKNTQLYLLKDILISYSISLFYPIGVCLLPGTFRIFSLRSKDHGKKIMYKFSQILELI